MLLTIGIPTFRRAAELTGLLLVIERQSREIRARWPEVEVRALVVDNDPDQTGIAAVAAFGRDWVSAVCEPSPGISYVRNRVLDELGKDGWLIFSDDDMVPEDGTLARLVQLKFDSGAAAVSGRYVPLYLGHVDPWIVAGGFFVRRSLPTGTVVPTAAAGILLLDLAVVGRLGLRFATAMGLTGGEDTLFTRQLTLAGEAIVWCDEATSQDRVPTDRLSRGWVLTRAFSHGNSAALIAGHLGKSPLSLGREGLVGGLARVGLGLARACLATIRRDSAAQARGLRMAANGAGRMVGGVGVAYFEYARGLPRWSRRRFGRSPLTNAREAVPVSTP